MIFSSTPLTEDILSACDSKFTSSPLYSGFTFSALTTNTFAAQRIREAFASCMAGILILSLAGLVLVILATGFTYAPLHKLAKKVAGEEDMTSGNVISNLDIYMTDGLKKNALLEEKVTKYRSQMQQAILTSLISTVDDPDMQKDVDLDSFFNPDTDNLITLIRVYANHDTDLSDDIRERVQNKLSSRFVMGSNLVTIASGSKTTTYILNINEPTESDSHKKNETLELIAKIARELGIRIAVSNFSTLALDIPSLFVNIDMCDKYIENVSLGDILIWDTLKDNISEENDEFPIYPHDLIEHFSTSLKDCDITGAENSLNELQDLIDSSYHSKNPSHEYITKCILIDIISELVNQMNDYGIKIKEYNDVYFEALYFCRSFPYSEKRSEIKTDLHTLLDIFVEHTSSAIITAQSLRIFVEQNYADPNFSITYLADKYNVSIANMSYLFKKELGVNFSNYLWDIRYKKANELLADGKNTVNKVAEAVGYLNVSSFRRKYKAETGHLPSEQRQ